MELKKIQINDEFEKCLKLMNDTDKNLFVTGNAGTGKSTLLEYFCKNTKKSPVILAPTGIAALNVNGQTIHKFFNFYIDITPDNIANKKRKIKNPEIYKKLQMIIIDEVSMLRADLLDCIDIFLRMHGKNKKQPFGGVQMVFIGDLYQLPPVVPNNQKHIFTRAYKTPYFFSANAIQTINLEIIELQKIYRQKDRNFIELLNKIRVNDVNCQDIIELNKRNIIENRNEIQKAAITLTTTNKNAEKINDFSLKKLDGKLYTSEAEIEGDFTREYFPTNENLKFKKKAQIMFLNNDVDGRWFNGSIGFIEDIYKKNKKKYLKVRLQSNNEIVDVRLHTWKVYKFVIEDYRIVSKPIGKFTQYPFKLAWAITIHKSQGKTFNNVLIDIGWGAFASGQTYVALSRCTSFEGITLKTPIQRKDIICDARIDNFMRGQL